MPEDRYESPLAEAIRFQVLSSGNGIDSSCVVPARKDALPWWETMAERKRGRARNGVGVLVVDSQSE